MKTIEQIKNEFKNATGKDMPVYTHKGQLGVIYERDTEYVKGLHDFKPMDDFLAMPDVDFEKVHWVDVNEDGLMEGEEIIETCIQNPEYDQGLLDPVWVTVAYSKSDEYVRELLITTTKYYSWKSKRQMAIDSLWSKLKHYDDELEYYSEHADELEEDEKQERDTTLGFLKDFLTREEKEWEDVCSRYENADDWYLDYGYDGHTAEFESLLKEVMDGTDFCQLVCDTMKEFINKTEQ